MLFVVLFKNLFTISRRLAFVIRAEVDGKSRDARMRQREMIGPVEMPLLGMSIGLNCNMHPPRDILNRGPHGGALGARYFNVLGTSERREGIEVQVERRFTERYEGMIGVIFRSAQAGLFRCDRDKDGRTFRLFR